MNLSRHESTDKAHFDRIAQTYARKDRAPSAQPARKQRLLQTLRLVPIETQSAAMLEVGCGAGFSAEYLAGQWKSFYGIDYSEKLIECARAENGHGGAEFEASNIQDFSPRCSFDLVFMIGVLHHIDDMPAALLRIQRLLKPGGWLAMNEPQSGNPLITGLRLARKRVDEDYAEDQITMSKRQVTRLLTDAGFEQIQVRPQGFLSTPFAEAPMRPNWLFTPLVNACCRLDLLLEKIVPNWMQPVSWNLIAVAQKPTTSNSSSHTA